MTFTLRESRVRSEIATTEQEQKTAERLLRSLASGARHEATAVLEVPTDLVPLVTRVVEAVARGESLTVVKFPEELSTSVAADQLGISRPTLMKLIARGEIPSHKVGSHTRLKTSDLAAFRRARLARQAKAFEELRELDEQFGW